MAHDTETVAKTTTLGIPDTTVTQATDGNAAASDTPSARQPLFTPEDVAFLAKAIKEGNKVEGTSKPGILRTALLSARYPEVSLEHALVFRRGHWEKV